MKNWMCVLAKIVVALKASVGAAHSANVPWVGPNNSVWGLSANWNLMLSSFGSRRLIAVMMLWMAASGSQADTVITTLPDWNGSLSVSSFGYPNTATYGQTITAPLVDTVLTSFSFEMNLPGIASAPANTLFKGYVYAWDGDSASGAQLFTSPEVDRSINGFQLITFDTGGIALTPGTSYVLFASISGLQGAGLGSWGRPDGNVYSGGEFVLLDNGMDASLWTTSAWVTGDNGLGGDLAFEATFTSRSNSVPEPSSLLLIGAALAGAVTLRKRRS